MLIVLALLLPACLHVETAEGTWTREVGACVPYAQTTTLAEVRTLGPFVVRGDTVLYGNSGDGLYEVRDGQTRRVAIGYTRGAFGVFEGDLVYFEVDPYDDARFTAVVRDRGGGDPATRYPRVSGPEARDVRDLFVIPAGIYWTDDGNGRRWCEGVTSEFDLSTTAWVVTNGREFFYRSNGDLVVKPADGSGLQLITQGMNDTPAAIGETELYYERSLGTLVDVIARSRIDGSERRLLEAAAVAEAIVDRTHFYWAHGWEILRVPLAGGPVETFYSGPDDTRVRAIATDECNVYWSTSAGVLYARAP